MGKKWVSTRADRESSKYKLLHAQLRRELKAEREPEDKRDRKCQASADFRAGRT